MRRTVVALIVLSALVVHAAPGDLDPTFGGGYVQRDIAGEEDLPQGMTALAGGGVAIAGRTLGAMGNEFAVMRYTDTGAPDPAFGGDGIVTTAFADNATAFAVAEQADGKLVAVGMGLTGIEKDFVIVRYEVDGDPDPTFGGGDGIVTFDLAGNDDEAHAIVVEPGGTLLVVGWSLDAGFEDVFTLIRLDAEGDLASSWGGDGIVTADFTNGARAFAAVRRASDGAIIAAGRTTFLDDDFAVARFDSDGDPDLTFSTDGFATAEFGSEDGAVAVMLDGDAIIAVGEQFTTGPGSDRDIAVAKFEGDGDPDPTFGGGDGLVATDIGPSTEVRGGTRLADGRIVALAQSATALSLVLVRYEPDGDLDPTFIGDGVSVELLLTQPAGVIPSGADQLLVATGFIAGGGSGDFGLARYDATGRVDRTFGDHGRFFYPVSNSGFDEANAVVVQPDGKIVIAGSIAGLESVVARFEANGAIDTSFGGSGDGMRSFDFGTLETLRALLLLPDGRIVAAGFSDQSIRLVQLESTGNPDPTFGGGSGTVTTDLGGAGGQGSAIARQSDGKLVVAGERGTLDASDMVVARFEANGDPDLGFGTGGFRAIDVGGEGDAATAVLVDPDGKIVVAGATNTTVGFDIDQDWAVARLDGGGTPDAGFGTGGVTTVGFDGLQDRALSVVRQASGRIVLGGRAGTLPLFTFALAGLTSGGVLDDGFGTGGKVVTDFPDGEDLGVTVLEQPDGRLVLAGFGDDAEDVPGFALARYTADGLLDDSFGTAGRAATAFYRVDMVLAGAALAPDGTVVAVGQGRWSNSAGSFALARYLVEGGVPGTTTTTLPGGGDDEICGNCIDDDDDGLTDFEDPSCCTAPRTLTLKRAVLKPAGATTKLTLRGSIGAGIAASTTGLSVQLLPEGDDELFCARVPAESFRVKKKTTRFVDKGGTIAGGLGKITLKARKDGSLKATIVGKRSAFETPDAGAIAITFGFGEGECATVMPTFRAKKKGTITAP
jgi:uncharacterized delta-60 repeat protein